MMALATGKGGNSVLYPVNGEKGKEGEKKRDSKRQKRNLRRETTEKERERNRGEPTTLKPSILLLIATKHSPSHPPPPPSPSPLFVLLFLFARTGPFLSFPFLSLISFRASGTLLSNLSPTRASQSVPSFLLASSTLRPLLSPPLSHLL